MNVCVIIPSLDPDEKILEVVKNVIGENFAHIIIIDDGSKSQEYFSQLEESCHIIHHYKNLGKGRGIKNALNYYMTHYSSNCEGVIIVDSDNQHQILDICACSQAMVDNKGSLILGVRDFKGSHVPHHNLMGNKITSFVFKALCGIDISDTQTGLRAISNESIANFLDVKGERFEYETNMLLETKTSDIPIIQVPIQTIYIEGNKSSHFNVFTDSFSIYINLIKFVWASLASTLIDFLSFVLCIQITNHLPLPVQIFVATVVSRLFSSLVNFLINHKLVFRSKLKVKHAAMKYYILCIVQMIASYFGVYGFTKLLAWSPSVLKIIVDLSLFLVSYPIQREWVFKKDKKIKTKN